MQATEMLRSPGTPSLSVTTRRRFTPQGTSCSALQAVTQPLHSMQRSASQMNFIRAMRVSPRQAVALDLADRRLGLLHHRHAVVAVGRGGVDRLAAHHRLRALRVVRRAGRRPASGPRSGTAGTPCSRSTRSVTSALHLESRAPVGVLTQTYSPLRMPRSLAAAGLISTNISCCSSASHGLERVSSPPPSYSTRRPAGHDQREVLADVLVLLLHASCTASAGARRPSCRRASGTWRPGRAACEYSGSRCCGTGSGKFQTTARALALPNGWQPWFFIDDADDAARQVGLPVLALGRLLLGVGELVPPAELLQQDVVELGIAGRDVGALASASRPRPAGSRRRARRRSWRGSCRRRPSRGAMVS